MIVMTISFFYRELSKALMQAPSFLKENASTMMDLTGYQRWGGSKGKREHHMLLQYNLP